MFDEEEDVRVLGVMPTAVSLALRRVGFSGTASFSSNFASPMFVAGKRVQVSRTGFVA